jgi:nucleoside-diphosphate-sugar epimerase
MMTGTTLVTGVGGLIGRGVAVRLAAAGHAVIGLDRSIPRDAPCCVLAHDLGDVHRLHEVILRHAVRRVVHAGGISGPMLLRDDPAKITAVNVGGLVDMLEAARIHQLERVVWFSTILAYGERADAAPVPEDAPLRPTTIYGATKVAGEALLAGYAAEHGVSAVALRVASCYGPGRTTACFIRTLIENARAGRSTRVADLTSRTRQHVYIDDVVDVVLTALAAPAIPQLVYNIGPGEVLNAAQIASQVCETVPSVKLEIDPAGMPWNTFALGPLDIAAARRDLDFAPRVRLPEGARRYAAWLDRQTGGEAP